MPIYQYRKTLPLMVATVWAIATWTPAEEGAGTRELSLQDLLNLKVEVASKIEEDVAEAPAVVTVITRREIENFNAISLSDVFNRAPSTQVISSHLWAQGKPVMRGFLITHTDNQLLVLINGRPFRDALGATNAFPFFPSFPVDLVERIEIVRGPGSVLYGSYAMSGVINIITREPVEKVAVMASAGAGSYGGKLAEATTLLSFGDLKVSVGANYFSEDGWDYRARTYGPGTLQRDSSMQYGEDNKGLAAFARYKRLNAQVSYSDTRNGSLGLLPSWVTAGNTQANRLFADLGYVQPIVEGWDFTANATYNQEEFSVVDATYRRESSEGILGEGTLRGEVGERLKFVGGGLFELLSNYDVLPFIAGVPAAKQAPGIPYEYQEQHYSGYLSADYRLIDPLKLIAGFQYHMISPDCEVRALLIDTLSKITGTTPNKTCSDKQAVVPRAGAIYAFNDDVSLKLLYGKAFRAATPLEEFTLLPTSTFGNPDLQAEYVTTYDAQLFINTSEAQYTFTLYYSQLEDIIARRFIKAGDVRVTFVNAASFNLFGAEFEAKVPITDRLYGTGSFTYQREEQDRLFIPDFMAKSGLFYDVKDLNAGVFGSLFGRGNQARDVNPNTRDFNLQAEPIFLLSLSLKYDFKNLTGVPLSLEGYGTNLFDDPMHYPEFARNEVNTLPMGPGRAFYGRASVRF
ncbi:MAG: TonB-dependent receptor [Fibrobacteria bacterium]